MNDMTNRRKFLKGGAIAGAAAVGTLAAPSIAKAAPTTLKMQAAWGGGIFLENAKAYVDRVHAMAGKDLKIDLLARYTERLLSAASPQPQGDAVTAAWLTEHGWG